MFGNNAIDNAISEALVLIPHGVLHPRAPVVSVANVKRYGLAVFIGFTVTPNITPVSPKISSSVFSVVLADKVMDNNASKNDGLV